MYYYSQVSYRNADICDNENPFSGRQLYLFVYFFLYQNVFSIFWKKSNYDWTKTYQKSYNFTEKICSQSLSFSSGWNIVPSFSLVLLLLIIWLFSTVSAVGAWERGARCFLPYLEILKNLKAWYIPSEFLDKSNSSCGVA